MNFDLPGEDDPRRLEVRAWLEAHPNPTYRDLYEQGYTAPHWPRPWGIDADPELQYIIDDEIERTGMMLPSFMFTTSIAMVAKLLLTYGTEWQRQHFLPPALSGEHFWAMLASEPSGGSDLAALRTVATRDGDDYVLKGTKIWNGGADAAKIGVVLARTDMTAPKHAGISLFLVPMDTPGISVTPIKDMMGENIFEPRMSDFNEIVFDNARIPATHRVGEEGQGWMLGTLILHNERAHLARPSVAFGLGPTARELLAGLDEIGALDDPVMADRLAELFVEGEVLRVLALQVLSEQINRKPPGQAANLQKMLYAAHGQEITKLAKEAQGPSGLVADVQPFPSQVVKEEVRRSWFRRVEDWDYACWYSLGATIGGGSQQIVRNTVAERMLGLPRDVDATARRPFNEVLREARS